MFDKKKILLVLALIAYSTSFGQNKNDVKISNVVRDFYQDFNQAQNALIVKADSTPDYEIFNYPEQKTITIKIRQATAPKSIARYKYFNDGFLNEVIVSKINFGEVWLEIHANSANYEYSVDKNRLDKGFLVIKFRTVKPTITYNPKAANALSSLELNPEVTKERLVFNFNSDFKFEPELTTLPNSKLSIKFPGKKREFEKPPYGYESDYISEINYKQQGNDLVVDLDLKTDRVAYNFEKKNYPNRLILTINDASNGLPITDNDIVKFYASPKLSSNDQLYKYYFAEAEKSLRANDFNTAAQKFTQIAKLTINTKIGVLALFRAAQATSSGVTNQEDYFKAVSQYNNAINEALDINAFPEEVAKAYLEIGKNYLNGKLYEEALDNFNLLLKKYPDSNLVSEGIYYTADIAFVTKKYSDAIRLFQNYLLRYPNSKRMPEISLKLGTAYHAIGDYDLAYSYFIKARSQPKAKVELTPEIQYAMSNTYFQQGQYQKFIDSARNLIESYPDNLLSHLVAIDLGDYFKTESNYANSEKYYSYATKSKNPDVIDIVRIKLNKLKGELRDPKSINDIIAEYQNIFNGTKNQNIKEEALLLAGITLLNYGKNNLADEAFERYIKLFPDGKYVKNGAIKSLILENITGLIVAPYLNDRFSDVISQYVRFRRTILDTNDPLLFWVIANSYAKLNNVRDAAAFYQQLQKITEKSAAAPISYALAENYYEAGQIDDAITYYTSVIAEYPGTIYDAYARSKLSKIEFGLKNYQQSIDQLKSLLKDYGDTKDPVLQDLVSNSWYDLANINKQLGMYQEALAGYQAAIDTYKHATRDQDAPEYIPLTFFYIADTMRMLNLQDQAIEAYKKAIEYFPNHDLVPWAYYYSAEILLNQEKYGLAYDNLQKVLTSKVSASDSLKKLASEKIKDIDINRNYSNFLKGDS